MRKNQAWVTERKRILLLLPCRQRVGNRRHGSGEDCFISENFRLTKIHLGVGQYVDRNPAFLNGYLNMDLVLN